MRLGGGGEEERAVKIRTMDVECRNRAYLYMGVRDY